MTDSERYDLMLDEIDGLKRENKDLKAQIAEKETTLGGTYIDINTHFRDIKKLKAEITALQGKIERGELVEVVRCINCKHLDVSDCGEGTIYCNNHKTYFYDDFSCPCGERSVDNG